MVLGWGKIAPHIAPPARPIMPGENRRSAIVLRLVRARRAAAETDMAKERRPTMNQQFAKITADVPALFRTLAKSTPLKAKALASQKGKAGVYAFFENGRAVHVGRTRNLQGRLRGHTTRSHYSATFAFKRARRALGMLATYKTHGSRAKLVNHATFGPEFDRQIKSVKSMQVRFVEIADPVAQYLLELYAHIEWALPLDEFETH